MTLRDQLQAAYEGKTVCRNLTHQPYMEGRNYRVSGDLTNTDIVMNNTFWIGLHPALTKEMLEYSVSKIESYLGVSFD